MGDELLISKQEETNEYDGNAVSIMMDDCLYVRVPLQSLNLDDCTSKKVVGNVPLNWSKFPTSFLQPISCFQIIIFASFFDRKASKSGC